MKGINHYWHWLKRDAARTVLGNKAASLYIAKNHLKFFQSMFYFSWTGKKMNWSEPEDFNQWLMKCSFSSSIDEHKRWLIAQCADKYSVRSYVTDKGYASTLNKLIGVYDDVDKIDFENLPSSFVMKMNNASGRNLICRDKNAVCWSTEREKFRTWLKDRNFGLSSGEWQYSLIEPKIVVEEYLDALDSTSLTDYKFNVIEGKVFSCFVGYDRNPDNPHGEVNFDDYDLSWNRTEAIKDSWHKERRSIPKPENLEMMIQMAEALSEGFDYCRFDVYEVEGKLYFGEMTFTPQGCVLEFYNDWYLARMLEFAKSRK